MRRVSLPEWIVPLGLVLGLLLALLLVGGALRWAAGKEYNPLIASILTLAILMVPGCFWLASLVVEGRVRGQPLTLTRKGEFPVLRQLVKDGRWYFIVQIDDAPRFVSYPAEMIRMQTTASQEETLEIRREGDLMLIIYFQLPPEPLKGEGGAGGGGGSG